MEMFTFPPPEFGNFSSEQQQSLQQEKPSNPCLYSSVLYVCPLLVGRGTGGSVAQTAERAGGPHSGLEQSPAPFSPLRRIDPRRDAPPMFSPSAGRFRLEVSASPAVEMRGCETLLLFTKIHTLNRLYVHC